MITDATSGRIGQAGSGNLHLIVGSATEIR